jgi:hypothetical protein
MVAKLLDIEPARGYALFDRRETLNDPNAVPVWLGHWWDVTANGEAVDASWRKPALAYLGERIAWGEVDDNGVMAKCAYTLAGDLITDLGVFQTPPPAVQHALTTRLRAFDSGR